MERDKNVQTTEFGPIASEGLTKPALSFNLRYMKYVIDIPDQLARQLDSERDRVTEIVARGLRRGWSGNSSLRREVISFLARRPVADAIIQFRPSEQAASRAQDLLRRNQEGTLTPEEVAELDDVCEIDRFVSLIKAEVLAQHSTAA